jgi:hypothetical protein
VAKLDKPTLAGIAFCALSVAAFSAYSQFETARLSGVPWQLSWVLPVTTDATGFVATRVWMTSTNSRGLRHYAAFITLACIALSIAGAGAHLALGDTPAPWQLRLTVGGLPSMALGALVHLVALLAAQRREATETENTAKKSHKRRTKRAASQAAGAAEPVRPPTSAAPVSTSDVSDVSTETGSDLNSAPVNASSVASPPEVGKGSKREQMLAHLDEHGEVTGAELDRIFGTKNYGRGVLKMWRKRHPQASGE